ncbi:MAG: tRNA (adenosine(37)-N6)-threonylcarbamoyltransferase complex dimerization subunit type 1 TsaB [Phycisphaerales bacterium]|nr:tRNA (adenosine(37)-N6)-threonylcarbamoyltransferase complex dimerization subunit type 1 TsaB [Phycisphaerales bacterium]
MSTEHRRILALETSGRMGSVALGDGRGWSVSARLSGNMKHTSELLPAVERLLCEQSWATDSLTDIFVSVGPGSFTGLRIGVTAARTLGWSVGSRIVAVPTLAVIACNALEFVPTPAHVAVVLDAKRQQVFTAAYALTGGRYRPLFDACLVDPREFLARCPRPLAVLGEGVDYHGEAVADSRVDVLPRELWPARAEHVLTVGLELADAGCYTLPGDLLPMYIRRPEAEEKWALLHPEKA